MLDRSGFEVEVGVGSLCGRRLMLALDMQESSA